MKSSKSSSSSRKKRVSPDNSKPKRTRDRSKSSDRSKVKTLPRKTRKTRWHAEKTPDRDDSSKKISPSQTLEKKEKSSPDPPLQIKDLVDDKDRLLEHLFATVTGTALQELIPDYLKERSTQELKESCREQLKQMSPALILHIAFGEDPSLYPNSEEQNPENKHSARIEEPGVHVGKKDHRRGTDQKSKATLPSVPNPDACESSSNDVLELFATSKEMEGIVEDENQVPLIVEEEVARELRPPESDAELLELEMRARAIRSLLKARSHALSGLDSSDPEPKKKKQ